MKKFICLICCLAFFIVCFNGCNKDTYSDVNGRYELKSIDNQFYLIINKETIESIESTIDLGINQVASIGFDSIEEFVSTLKNGKLSDDQLAIANRAFKKDSTGKIIVCDVSNIRVPVCPNEFDCMGVEWSGELYSYHLESGSGEFAYYHYLSKDAYEYQYENDYLNFFSKDTVSLEKTVDSKEATEYYYSTATGDMKKVRYSVTNGDTLLYVDETYRLRMEDDSLQISDTVPYRITIYGSAPNGYFRVEAYDLEDKPTLEWLMKFGIKIYK